MENTKNRFTTLVPRTEKDECVNLRAVGAKIEKAFYDAVSDLAKRNKLPLSCLVERGLAAMLVEAGIPVPKETEARLLNPVNRRGKSQRSRRSQEVIEVSKITLGREFLDRVIASSDPIVRTESNDAKPPILSQQEIDRAQDRLRLTTLELRFGQRLINTYLPPGGLQDHAQFRAVVQLDNAFRTLVAFQVKLGHRPMETPHAVKEAVRLASAFHKLHPGRDPNRPRRARRCNLAVTKS